MAVNNYDQYGFLQKVGEEPKDKVLSDLQQLEADQYEDLWKGLIVNNKDNAEKIKNAVYERAIPNGLRSQVWPVLANIAELRKTKQANYFQTLLEKEDNQSCDQIRLDLGRTFTSHKLFIEGKLQQSLYAVLKGYSMHNPRVGYCQGMAFIAGVLLMYIENVEDCFWVLVSMMEKKHDGRFWTYFEPNMSGTLAAGKTFESLMDDQFGPEVKTHFKSMGIDCLLFITPWFMTMFTSLAVWAFVLRTFDIFLLDGVVATYRISLGIISSCKTEILSAKAIEKLLPLLLNIPASKLTDDLLTEAMRLDIEEKLATYHDAALIAVSQPVKQARPSSAGRTTKKSATTTTTKSDSLMNRILSNLGTPIRKPHNHTKNANTKHDNDSSPRKRKIMEKSEVARNVIAHEKLKNKRSALSPLSPSNQMKAMQLSSPATFTEKTFFPSVKPLNLFDDDEYESDKENVFQGTTVTSPYIDHMKKNKQESFIQFSSPRKSPQDTMRLQKIGVKAPLTPTLPKYKMEMKSFTDR